MFCKPTGGKNIENIKEKYGFWIRWGAAGGKIIQNTMEKYGFEPKLKSQGFRQHEENQGFGSQQAAAAGRSRRQTY